MIEFLVFSVFGLVVFLSPFLLQYSMKDRPGNFGHWGGVDLWAVYVMAWLLSGGLFAAAIWVLVARVG